MPKDPAFLFYPKDWIEGTAEMHPAEKGVYIDLLAHQHQKKDLPNDTKRLARIVGLSHDEFMVIWNTLKEKFSELNGRIVNEKLIRVTNERINKAFKNKIVGIFSAILRREKPELKKLAEIKKSFNVNDFIHESSELLYERIYEWYINRIASLEDANANEDANTNTNTGKDSTKGKPNLTFEEEKFYPDKTLHIVDLTEDEMDNTISYLEVVCAKEFKTASVKNQWLAPPEIERQWKAFKIQYFNGETPYDNWGDAIQHFRDWLKNGVRKINENGNKSTTVSGKPDKPGTSEARIEALRNWGK